MTDPDLQSQLFLTPKSPPSSLAEYLTDRLNRLQPSPEALVLIVALIIGGGSGLTVVLFRYLIALVQSWSYEKLLGIISVGGGWPRSKRHHRLFVRALQDTAG